MLVKQIRGIVHWADDEVLLRSVGRRIDVSYDGGSSFKIVGKVDVGFVRNLASIHRLGIRFVRGNVKHIVRLGEQKFLAFAGRHIFSINLKTNTVQQIAKTMGSRPLRICCDGNTIYYGEYRSNPERTPIHIWKSTDGGHHWQIHQKFQGIRHIHGIFKDPYDDSFWVTVGDEDDEAAIWRYNSDWEAGEKIFSGSQLARVIDLLFDDREIVFGTDAPEGQNWIMRYLRSTGETQKVAPVKGPVFHARTCGGLQFFSTAREPSKTNQVDDIEVLYLDGDGPKVLQTFRKDVWSMKYFQHGQASFADGNLSNNQIWISPLATDNDQSSFLFDMSSAKARID